MLKALQRHWPEELPRYARLYPKTYLQRDDGRATLQLVGRLRSKHAISDRRPVRDLPAPPPRPQQLAIAFG